VIHVVTDSTSDLTPAQAGGLGVTVVPLIVRFGEDQFRDGVDLDSEAFYRRLTSSKVHPTTSQPSPEEFSAVYRSLLRGPDDSVVSIHISSHLSGTLQSAHLAVQELGPARVHLVDSGSVTAGLQMLVRSALDDVAEGCDAGEVVERALARKERIGIYVLLDTLTYLLRGGRIGRAQAMVGGLLNVKPVLTVRDGEVAPQARVRSRRQGFDLIADLIRKRLPLRRLAVFDTGAPELVGEMRGLLEDAAPGVDILLGQVGPVVGTYAGPGGLGVAYLAAG